MEEMVGGGRTKMKNDDCFPDELRELVDLFFRNETSKVDLLKGEVFNNEVYHRILNLDLIKDNGFEIEWNKSPNLPIGVQEFGLGIISRHLVIFTGYSCIRRGKPKKQIRGFSSYCFAINLDDPIKTWKTLPNFPGQERQGSRTCVVNDKIYIWGGSTYKPMNYAKLKKIPQHKWPPKSCSKAFFDGYCLSDRNSDQSWEWSMMPPLPYPNTNFGICSDGIEKIYVCFGAAFDPKSKNMGYNSEWNNNLYCLNLNQLEAGWKMLSKCPGSPRINCSMAVVNNQIYVIGGVYPNANWKYTTCRSRFRTVLDQWKYDLSDNTWSRLINNQIETGNWGGNDQIVYQNRYLILVGGAYFPEMVENGKIVKQKIKPCLCHSSRISHCGCGAVFLNKIFAYDTCEDKFIKCKQDLPGYINLPQYKIVEDQIYLMGGEAYQIKYEGKSFCIPHLDLNFQGTIKFIDE